MKQNQQGFTLIELVVVIVILGLLAATALPKYIDVTSDARRASVQGVAGGLRAAAALGQAQYVVNGDKNATTISMGGSTVTVLDETTNPGRGGRPTNALAGIRTAMPDPDGFAIGTSGGVTYYPNTYASEAAAFTANCVAIYNATNTGDAVTTNVGGGSGC